MKIAVCLAGQIRTGIRTSESILDYLGNLRPNCDFFIHTWKTRTPSPGFEIKSDRPEDFRVDVPLTEISAFHRIYCPISFVVDDFDIFIRTRTFNERRGISMPFYYSVSYSLEQKCLLEKNRKIEYDYVVVLRPDICIESTKKLIDDINHLVETKSNMTFVDMHLDGDKQIDSTLWVCDNKTSNQLKEYDNYRITTGKTNDDQIELKEWLENVWKTSVTPMPNKNVWIYRKHHEKMNVHHSDYTTARSIDISKLFS